MFNKRVVKSSAAASSISEGGNSYVCARLDGISTYYRGASISASVTNEINAEGKVISHQVIIVDGKRATVDDPRKINHIHPSLKAKLDLAIDNLNPHKADDVTYPSPALK